MEGGIGSINNNGLDPRVQAVKVRNELFTSGIAAMKIRVANLMKQREQSRLKKTGRPG